MITDENKLILNIGDYFKFRFDHYQWECGQMVGANNEFFYFRCAQGKYEYRFEDRKGIQIIKITNEEATFMKLKGDGRC
jgi:hypothetical protein